VIKKKSDQSDRDEVVLSYSGYIRSLIKQLVRQYKRRPDEEDLFQEGMTALLEAINESSGLTDSSVYFKWRIKEAILVAILKELGINNFKASLWNDFAKYRQIRADLRQKLKRQPTISELSEATGFTTEKTEQFQKLYKIALNYDE